VRELIYFNLNYVNFRFYLIFIQFYPRDVFFELIYLVFFF